jgi:hypothetical protein
MPSPKEAADVAMLSADLAAIVREAQENGTSSVTVISSLLSGLAYEAVEAGVPLDMVLSLVRHAFEVAESRKAPPS